MRNARVVHQHVETAKLVAYARRRGGDGALIGDVELDGTRVRPDALRGRLPILEVARPDEHGEAVRREILRSNAAKAQLFVAHLKREFGEPAYWDKDQTRQAKSRSR